MKFKLISLSLLIISFFTIQAQKYAAIEDADVLKEQEKVLKSTHPQLFGKAQIVEILKAGEEFSIVRYKKDGNSYETIINSGRKDMLLIETGKMITSEELPDVVRDAFMGKHPEARITKQYKVERPNGEVLYRIDYKGEDGDEDSSDYFDDKGQYASHPLE